MPQKKSDAKASSPEEAVGIVKEKTITERHEKTEVLRRGMKAASPTSRGGRKKSKVAAATKAAAITTTTATTTTIITAAARKKEKELSNEGQRKHWKL